MIPDFFLDAPEETNVEKVSTSMGKTASQGDDVLRLFEKVKSECNKEVVSSINAVFQFDINGEGPWYLDLKTGSGRCKALKYTTCSD